MLFPGQAVDSAHLHVFPPFKTPSGGGLGKPPNKTLFIPLLPLMISCKK